MQRWCHVVVWSENPIVNRIKRFAIAGKLRNCCLECESVPIAAVNWVCRDLRAAHDL